MYDLTGIYWIRNEGPYLPEYIEFHLLQGFDHFIFYDNDSTDRTEELMAPYVEEGLVELRKYPPELTFGGVMNPKGLCDQMGCGGKPRWVQNYCAHEQIQHSKWIHYHAIDERIFCPDGAKLPDRLKDYEEFPGVSVGWKLFNSNDHLTKPKGLVIENYYETFSDLPCHIKTIIQPKYVDVNVPNTFEELQGDLGVGAHTCRYLDGKFAVDENKARLEADLSGDRDSPFHPYSEFVLDPDNKMHGPSKRWGKDFAKAYEDIRDENCSYTMNKICNHHYITMSKEEYDAKASKGHTGKTGWTVCDNATANMERGLDEATTGHAWDGLNVWQQAHQNRRIKYSPWGIDKSLSIYVEAVTEAIKSRYAYLPYGQFKNIMEYLGLKK